MAVEDEKLYWVGDKGPYYYDSSIPYAATSGEWGDETGEYDDPDDASTLLRAFRTSGLIETTQAPSEDNHVVRLADLTTGLGDITIPYGFSLIFAGATSGSPKAEFRFIDGVLYLFIGGVRVGSWRVS